MGISQPIQDILSQLQAIESLQFVRVWNNQFQQIEGQTIYSFPFPCAFVEVVPNTYNALGAGFKQSDIIFRIHIGHEYYDAQDGTFEQDLPVFDLRDLVIKSLQNFVPTNCTPMNNTGEEQDYNHTNIYHYIIEFLTGFIDTTGSDLDTFIYKAPPTDFSGIKMLATSAEIASGVFDLTDKRNYQI